MFDKLKNFLGIIMVLVVLGMLSGCGDDDATEPTQTAFEILSEYMAANALDLPTMLTDWIVTAQTVFDNGGSNYYFIMDVRTSDKYGPGTSGANGVDDFEDGHITGAHNVPLADIVTYEAANNTGDLPVVLVCYTGHSAGHAVMALRLSGVAAQSLKWGMSGWHSDFDLWTGNTGNVALDYPDAWSTDDPPALPAYDDYPVLDTGLETGAAILEYQIDNAVLDGYNGITNIDVLADYENYQVICYWAESDWDLYGHITGSFQVTPGELGTDNLSILDPDAMNVFYCWTGQTASMIAAWLNILGYDAMTLSYSCNGMIYDQLQSHNWTGSADLAYDSGS